MVQTVNDAFTKFLAEEINLDSGQTMLARASRDWLVDRLHEFPAKDKTFPTLYSGQDIFFGSFERKTKKRPLDDIDIMLCLGGYGASYIEYDGTVYIDVTDNAPNLKRLCHDNGTQLNSRRVINKFISLLSGIPQYKKADINRNFEAATLQLQSYDWNFDIVPCFLTTENSSGRSFYLIPDGEGHWKKTDPRIDRNRTATIAKLRGKSILSAIRLIKFWNARPTMPSMPSYMLENMILDFYEQRAASDHIDFEFRYLLEDMGGRIYAPVHDPKGIQGDLNTVSFDDRIKISARCKFDAQRAQEAWSHEQRGDHRSAINKWREIFGDTFPLYG